MTIRTVVPVFLALFYSQNHILHKNIVYKIEILRDQIQGKLKVGNDNERLEQNLK